MATNGSSMGGNIVNIFDSMLKTLNSGIGGSITSNNNNSYSVNMGSQNFSNAVARLGPNNIYQHVMTAAANPTYGRDFSLAHQYERPQTRFPLAEEQRPNERSENSQQTQMPLFASKQLNPSSIDPFKNTVILYNSDIPHSENRKNERYQGYNSKYSGDYKTEDGKHKTEAITRSKFNPVYKISSIALKVEKQGKEYFKKAYDTFFRKEDVDKVNENYNSNNGVGYKILNFLGKSSVYARKESDYKPETMGDDLQNYSFSLPTYSQNMNPTSYSDEGSYGLKKTKIPDSIVNPLDLSSLPTLDEFMKWQELKIKHQGSSNLEKIADSSITRN
jgi:hypothetical protein